MISFLIATESLFIGTSSCLALLHVTEKYAAASDYRAVKRMSAWEWVNPVILPLSHETAAHPSCRSGRGRGSTAGSHQAVSPRWHLYIQTGLQGWVPCIAPWPARTPDPPTDPHSSWSVTGSKQKRGESCLILSCKKKASTRLYFLIFSFWISVN